MAANLANSVKVSVQSAATATTAAITSTSGGTFVASYQGPIVTVNTPTDSKSNAYTLRESVGISQQIFVYAVENGTGGASHTCTITTATAPAAYTVYFCEAQGVATASVDAAASTVGSDSASPWTLTSGTLAQANNLALAYVANPGLNDPYTFTEGSGFTKAQEETDIAAYYPSQVAWKVTASTAALATTWTASSGPSEPTELVVLVLKEASEDPANGGRIGIRGPRFNRAARRPFAGAESVAEVTAALTGESGPGAAGSVGVTVDKALAGNASTGSAGTVGPSVSIALTGNAATGAAGTVAPATSASLTGGAATGAAGSTGVAVDIALTGVSATGAVGTVTAVTGSEAALTGVAGTGNTGTVAASTDKALAGNAGTGAVGTVSPGTSAALTGNVATGAAGTVAAATSKGLTGNAATGAAGAVGPDITLALTGVSGTGAVGSVTVTPDGAVALTGVSGTGAAGQTGVAVTVALTGVAATGLAGSVAVAGAAVAEGHGFEMGGVREVSFKPLLQRILEERAPRVKPASRKAAKRAKIIEVQAAQAVLHDASEGQFKAFMAQWLEQKPVIPEAEDDTYALFMAAVAFRLKQLEDDEDDALLALLL